MQRKLGFWLAAAAVASLTMAGEGKAVVAPQGDLKWVDQGIPGVSAATVDGDMKKGASHFFLKYPAGLVTPLHHHSPDHYVTVMSGNLVLVVDGKDHAVPPGHCHDIGGFLPRLSPLSVLGRLPRCRMSGLANQF